VLPPPGVDGYVTVEMSYEFKVDSQSPKGKNGGPTVTLGRDKAEVSIELVYNDGPTSAEGVSQHDLVEQAVKAIVEEFRIKKALDVAHGSSYFTDTRAITLKKITSPKFQGGKGVVKITGKQWQFKPNSPNVTGTATAAGGTKQWYQDKTPSPGIPLGEWQPVGSVP
jgi:hypothetical protein